MGPVLCELCRFPTPATDRIPYGEGRAHAVCVIRRNIRAAHILPLAATSHGDRKIAPPPFSPVAPESQVGADNGVRCPQNCACGGALDDRGLCAVCGAGTCVLCDTLDSTVTPDDQGDLVCMPCQQALEAIEDAVLVCSSCRGGVQ